MVPIIDEPHGRPPEDPGDPDEPVTTGSPTEQSILDEISREILHIYETSYGRGAGRSHSILNGDWVMVVLDDLHLLPNELFLIDNGKRDTVVQVRTQYQHAIQAPMRAAVERSTGRRVVGFASTTSLDEPRFAVETFKLE